MANKTIIVEGNKIVLFSQKDEDYISLTDIARYKNHDHPADIIKNWTRAKYTIEFLGLWERINNQEFKVVEFDQFRIQAGNNSFVLSPQKWIEKTNAIGLISKSGKYGGTFAHRDIAFEFASWISAEFLIFNIQSGEKSIEVKYVEETVWISQKMMAKLFDVTIPTINEHLKNIYQSKELEENAVIRKFRTTASDGKAYETLVEKSYDSKKELK